jgi:hypothetical protein
MGQRLQLAEELILSINQNEGNIEEQDKSDDFFDINRIKIPYLLKTGKTNITTVAKAKSAIEERRNRILRNRHIYKKNQ